jgi:uncharacterized Zn finger protein (UPF0148 family)
MDKKAKYSCAICGSPLYKTDGGGPTATLQCSSDEAKFWLLERGTEAQKHSHEHFVKSAICVPKKEWEDEKTLREEKG